MNHAYDLRLIAIKLKVRSYLELIFSHQFHLIGRVVLKYLSGTEISFLRIAYPESKNNSILNDSFLLFQQKIKPNLPKQAAHIWHLIIEKTVLELRYARPHLSSLNNDTLCNIFFNLADSILFKEVAINCIFRQPIIILILYQSRGGSSIIFQLDHYLSTKEKRAFYNCYNRSDLSPIHLAAKFDLVEIVKVLIPYVTLRNRKSRFLNQSVYNVASKNGSSKVLRLLRSYSSRDFRKIFKINLHWLY